MTATDTDDRTARLLALMKKGDDAFDARDMAGMDAVHHPGMIAHVTGNAQPLCGRAAHAAAMQQMFRSQARHSAGSLWGAKGRPSAVSWRFASRLSTASGN